MSLVYLGNWKVSAEQIMSLVDLLLNGNVLKVVPVDLDLLISNI